LDSSLFLLCVGQEKGKEDKMLYVQDRLALPRVPANSVFKRFCWRARVPDKTLVRRVDDEGRGYMEQRDRDGVDMGNAPASMEANACWCLVLNGGLNDEPPNIPTIDAVIEYMFPVRYYRYLGETPQPGPLQMPAALNTLLKPQTVVKLRNLSNRARQTPSVLDNWTKPQKEFHQLLVSVLVELYGFEITESKPRVWTGTSNAWSRIYCKSRSYWGWDHWGVAYKTQATVGRLTAGKSKAWYTQTITGEPVAKYCTCMWDESHPSSAVYVTKVPTRVRDQWALVGP